MEDKKYAFIASFSRFYKIPVYVTYPKLNVIEIKSSKDFKVHAEGIPSITGTNWIYEICLGLAIKWIYFYAKYINPDEGNEGWYYKIKEIVEIED